MKQKEFDDKNIQNNGKNCVYEYRKYKKMEKKCTNQDKLSMERYSLRQLLYMILCDIYRAFEKE